MNKKTLLGLIICLNLSLAPLLPLTSQAAWTPEDIGGAQNDLWAVWGSSADDVYAVGMQGINVHYDGNPQRTWTTIQAISP